MFVWHHHSLSITQYFSHYLWAPYLSLGAVFSFFFSLVPKLTEPSKKKKTQNKPNSERRRRRKKRIKQPTQEKKGKKKSQKVVRSCGWVLFVSPLCVFNYNIAIELWVMKTENSQNVFSVSITHNSKIIALSDGNRVMETELSCAKRILSYGSHNFWVMSYRNWELSYENRLSKQPLIFSNKLALAKNQNKNKKQMAHLVRDF